MAHKQGNVRPLATVVSVQFVEHQKLRLPCAGLNDVLLKRGRVNSNSIT